jgi:hypothetical protein
LCLVTAFGQPFRKVLEIPIGTKYAPQHGVDAHGIRRCCDSARFILLIDNKVGNGLVSVSKACRMHGFEQRVKKLTFACRLSSNNHRSSRKLMLVARGRSTIRNKRNTEESAKIIPFRSIRKNGGGGGVDPLHIPKSCDLTTLPLPTKSNC